jgi:hypothetical protein
MIAKNATTTNEAKRTAEKEIKNSIIENSLSKAIHGCLEIKILVHQKTLHTAKRQ